jgi:S1-C subfamily serine protease
MGQAPQKRSSVLLSLLVTLMVLTSAAIGFAAGYAAWNITPKAANISPSVTVPSVAPGSGTAAKGQPSDSASIAAKVDPGIVDINVDMSYQSLLGAGTGMVLSSNGEILTNNHVIEDATNIKVVDIGDGKTYSAKVVGYDRTQDVAVLKLSGASNLATVKIGDSSNVKVGTAVVAVGNAGGAGGTPSYAGGEVSGLNQSVAATDEANGSSEQLSGLLETNAEVVSGDSGGPMVNGQGEVIGMDTAGNASGGFQFQSPSNAGYAIPINEAVNVANQIESGTSSAEVHVGPTAFLGVNVSLATGSSGAEIVGLVAGGPAENVGLGEGDVITSIGGVKVSSPMTLSTEILSETPGESVELGYLDTSAKAHSVSITLGTGPAQ